MSDEAGRVVTVLAAVVVLAVIAFFAVFVVSVAQGGSLGDGRDCTCSRGTPYDEGEPS